MSVTLDKFLTKGNQGNKWVKTRVSIGRRYEPFFLNFTATVGGGVRGDIAIDEISFENCGHPPLCTGNDPGKFMYVDETIFRIHLSPQTSNIGNENSY